jgi:hypothetical protein
MIQIDAPGLFERLVNGLLLLMSFFLILYVLHVSQMEKREWCSQYIATSQCVCIGTDTSQLLNDSVDIVLPNYKRNSIENNFTLVPLKPWK